MGIFDFFKKSNKQQDDSSAKKFTKEEVDTLVLTALNVFCNGVSTADDVMAMLKGKGYDDRQALVITERAQSLYDKHFAEKVQETLPVKNKSLNEIYAEKRLQHNGVLPTTKFTKEQFNTEQFQVEMVALAESTYFQNNQNIGTVKHVLLKEGLSPAQAETIITKFSALNKNRVNEFEDKLASGEISIGAITPNPAHQPGNVDATQIDKYIGYGAFQMQNQNYSNAIELFNKAIELGDQTGLAYANLGSVHHELGDYQKAIEAYDRSIQLNPKDARFFVNKALSLQELNDNEAAILNYKKSIEIDQNNATALNNLGVLLISNNNYAEALPYFEQVLKLHPNDSDALINKVSALIRVDLDQALTLYVSIDQAIDLTEIEIQLIDTLLGKDPENVVSSFLENRYQSTKNARYIKLQALVLYKIDKLAGFELLSNYLALHPTDRMAIDLKVNFAFELLATIGEHKFIHAIDECLVMDSQNPTALAYKVQTLLKQQHISAALDKVEQLFAIHYPQQYVLTLFNQVYSKLQKEEALARFESFANQLDSDAKYQLGYMKGLYLKNFKDYDEAIALFSELNEERKFSWNYYQIAIMENLRGNVEKCLLNLKRTFELEPELKEDARHFHELENLQHNPNFLSLIK